MSFIQEELFRLADKEYADFQAKLAPTIDRETFIGVRVPELRKFAKVVQKHGECEQFLRTVPHSYYDENMLHSILISGMKKYEECLEMLEIFLPYVDNWAVCDTLRPKIFAKHKDAVLAKIHEWVASDHVYTCRFGIDMLMTYYLDDDFKEEYLAIPATVTSDEYYVKMMVAWYYATALAKQWDATIVYLTENRLPVWTHNKTIQKAKESNRITPEQKTFLNDLKRAD